MNQTTTPGRLLAATIWRVFIAGCALLGFDAAITKHGFDNAIPGLSQQANLLTGIVYLALALYPLARAGRAHEPRSPWWRGAMAVLLLLVGLTYTAVMSGPLEDVETLFEHVFTPLLVLIDWIAFGGNQAQAKWWYPFTWLCFPLAYLGYFLIASPGLYGGFLNPRDSGYATTLFATTLVTFLLVILIIGFVLYGLAMLRTQRRAQRQPNQP